MCPEYNTCTRWSLAKFRLAVLFVSALRYDRGDYDLVQLLLC